MSAQHSDQHPEPGWGQPPWPPQRTTRPKGMSGLAWGVAAGALVVGLILGAAVNGTGAPEVTPTTQAPAVAAPQAATPGTCLQALDMVAAGQADSEQYQAAAKDCRGRAAAAAAPATPPDTQPVEAADEPPAPAPEPEAAPQPQPVTVPDVVHFTYADALDLLEDAGVPAEAVEQVPLGEDSIAINPFNWIVLESVPAAGETWQPGDAVRLGMVKRDDPMAAGIQPRLE